MWMIQWKKWWFNRKNKKAHNTGTNLPKASNRPMYQLIKRVVVWHSLQVNFYETFVSLKLLLDETKVDAWLRCFIYTETEANRNWQVTEMHIIIPLLLSKHQLH